MEWWAGVDSALVDHARHGAAVLPRPASTSWSVRQRATTQKGRGAARRGAAVSLVRGAGEAGGVVAGTGGRAALMAPRDTS